MSIKLDFYYAPKNAESFAKFNKEPDVELKLNKESFNGKVFTDCVPEGDLPECGCAEATFIGTGKASDIHFEGKW